MWRPPRSAPGRSGAPGRGEETSESRNRWAIAHTNRWVSRARGVLSGFGCVFLFRFGRAAAFTSGLTLVGEYFLTGGVLLTEPLRGRWKVSTGSMFATDSAPSGAPVCASAVKGGIVRARTDPAASWYPPWALRARERSWGESCRPRTIVMDAPSSSRILRAVPTCRPDIPSRFATVSLEVVTPRPDVESAVDASSRATITTVSALIFPRHNSTPRTEASSSTTQLIHADRDRHAGTPR